MFGNSIIDYISVPIPPFFLIYFKSIMNKRFEKIEIINLNISNKGKIYL